MQVWLVKVPFGTGALTEELFESALRLVDEESEAKIKRFYHVEDRWRCLIGRLLPRHLLISKGLEYDNIKFGKTEAGKPFILSPKLEPPIAFNITHDNNFVGMAFYSDSPNNDVGIDLMKVEIPKGETARSFAEILEDQLTHRERLCLKSLISKPADAATLIFKYWTTKEAYTKALGLGLGFDFSRLEYDETTSPATLSVEGKPLVEWCVRGFTWNDGNDRYMGVAARPNKGEIINLTWTPMEQADWVSIIQLADLIG